MRSARNGGLLKQGAKVGKWWLFALLRFCLLLPGVFAGSLNAQTYPVKLHAIDGRQDVVNQHVRAPEVPMDIVDANQFAQSIVPLLQEKGFLAASVDSTAADAEGYHVFIYVGQLFRWAKVSFDSIPQGIMVQAGGSREQWAARPLDPKQISRVSQKLLQWAENNGYPFARVWLETLLEADEGVSGLFMLDKGPERRLDSITVHSEVKVSRAFILRSLDLKQGEYYNEQKMAGISNRIRELSFLQEAAPWAVEFTEDKTTLNLYLKERKANQLNAIVGLLPNNAETGKLLLTVDALFAFQNILGQGESINVSYQNLQYRSPRLKASFVYPYLLGTPFGIDLQFDLFRKDTSFRRTFFQGGVRYQLTAQDYVRVFYHHQSNRLITVDTAFVKGSKQLPEDVDVTAQGAGVEFGFNHTDYRISPRRGWELRLSTSALLRKVRPSDAITGLSDASGFDYASLYDTLTRGRNQFIISGHAGWYVPVLKKLVLKSSYYGGFISGDNLFRNELFQIGGFRLLRGFDEQSIFTNQYHVVSEELRLLLDQNSFFYLFSDNGYVETPASRGFYHGFGIGATLETKSGLFTISYALGQSPANPLQFRQSKVHFGYVAYF